MQATSRAAVTCLSLAIMMAVGCSPGYRSKSGRKLNAELTVVSFGSNNGEVAPCG